MSIWNRTLIQQRLDCDDKWVGRAILAIYRRQTLDEQERGETKHQNGMGFSAVDSVFFSSLARFYQERGFLTKRQIEAARRADIGKYWSQLLEIIQANERMKQGGQ